MLVLVEPTSAVDAHTEVLLVERLPPIRRGQTTIEATSCPEYRNIVPRGGDMPTVRGARDA